MSAAAVALGDAGARWRLTSHASLPSTSDRCIALARAGEPAGLAVLARHQTGARGTRGRSWESMDGNLFLSVLLRPGTPAQAAGHWALLAGVALIEALGTWLPDPAILTLKWPNDLLLRGGKLAGILIDSALDPQGRIDWLVLGFGANLAVAPAVPGRVTAALAEAGTAPPAPEAVAAALLDRLAHWQRVSQIEGFAPIRAAWLARAHRPGSLLSLRQGDAMISGRFAGLSDQGGLLLQIADRIREFATGEILQAEQG